MWEKFLGQKLSREQARLKDTMVFFVRLMVMALPLYAIIWFADLFLLQSAVASQSFWIFQSLGLEPVLEGITMQVGDFVFFISKDSTGWKSMLFLSALIVAVPGIMWRKRLIGIGLGVGVVYLGNMGRVVGIVLAEQAWGVEAALYTHDFLWRFGLVALVLVSWLVWLRWARAPSRRRRRKAVAGMGIDWVIAIAAFLVFALWAFSFYSQLFIGQQQTSPGESLEEISDKLLANLSVTVYSIPLHANISNVSLNNKVLYFDYRWPFGKNTTKVLKGSSSQSCNITGNTLYWRSNLAAGVNEFTVKFSEQKANLSCSGGFSVVNQTQVVPFVAEEMDQISRARIEAMNATNYSVFKANLGVSRDFNITITNVSTTKLTYGLSPPRGVDVFSKRLRSKLEETEENLTIRILTW